MTLVDTNSAPVPGGMANVCILDILSRADVDCPLTQNQIQKRLEEDYGITIDRKTLHRHIEDIVESVPRVQYTRKDRNVGGTTTSVMTDFWLEGEFEQHELQALIYYVIFAKHIRKMDKEKLVHKLEELSSSDLRRKMKHYVQEQDATFDTSPEFFLNMEELSQAIEDKRMVRFRYKHYGADKKLAASDQIITASPLGIGVAQGEFYFVALVDGVRDDTVQGFTEHIRSVISAMEDKQVHVDVFRMDLVTKVDVLDRPCEKLSGARKLNLAGVVRDRLDMHEHMRQNPTLRTGHAVRAQIRLTEGAHFGVHDAIDYFGKENVKVKVEKAGGPRTPAVYDISITANGQVVRDFALLNAPAVEVLKPSKLRSEIRESLRVALDKMGEE